jgi:hypothetical protein
MDSKRNQSGAIGELSELAVLYKLRKMGYEVFKSTCPSSRWDLLPTPLAESDAELKVFAPEDQQKFGF